MAVAFLAVLGGDLITQRLVVHSVPRQTMASIATAARTIDLLGIGNSLMAAGFDPDEIERVCREGGRPCVAVNAGLGSTTTIEHLDLARFSLSRHRVKTLIYGYFDQQMSVDAALKNADLIGNHSMLYYQEPELTLRYAHFDGFNRLAFQVYRCCALLRERSAIWAKVERLRRQIGAVGMPAE